MKRTETRSGTSLPMVVFVIFLVLKLVGVIAWSWWWVLAPLWIPFLIGVDLGTIYFFINQ